MVQLFAQQEVANAPPEYRRRAQVRPPCTPDNDLPSVLEVEETIERMSDRKVVGPDELPAGVLKFAIDGDRDGNRRDMKRFHAGHSTIEVHPIFSEDHHLRCSIPHPKLTSARPKLLADEKSRGPSGMRKRRFSKQCWPSDDSGIRSFLIQKQNGGNVLPLY